ncbi:hypothetical protein [Nocardiopsis alba]|uniref:hypothetical protein n=1 Tax=Nocardiopsis alba TaxID=53437 RepID=UPI003D714C2D
MPDGEPVLLFFLTTIILTTIAHAAHRLKIRKSNITVPDMEHIDTLRKNLKKIEEMRSDLAGANGSLSGRINAIEEAIRDIETGSKEYMDGYVKKNLLKAREASEGYVENHVSRRTLS